MRAVWSFWTKPWRARSGWGWSSEKHHLLAWVLSVECARRHYPATTLVTDSDGARMLIDGLGLEIEEVSTELDRLATRDPALWMMGKLSAYRTQSEPFVHLDTDVFLWKPLPEHVEAAPVFAQNPEYFSLGASHYRPERMQRIMRGQTQGWIPKEWEWALSFGNAQRGECCGIVGGNHLAFIRYYADTALRVIEEPCNREGWARVSEKYEYNTLIEQYHLAACVDYHRNRPDSPYRGVAIRYLFDSGADAFDPNHAAKLGFSHLIAHAKRSAAVAARLEKRVAQDYPAQYERCLDYARQLEK